MKQKHKLEYKNLLKRVFKIPFARFILVGIFNTIFGYGLYALFISLGMKYTSAVFFATILGVFFNFKTIGFYVFASKDHSLIIKFFIVYSLIYFLNKFFVFENNDLKIEKD